ncbi:serine/threonine protein kinase [Saccharopolyspora sp. K220]|uniref:serine/threonine-protein kinase n=1 Tax=Saccharopolyspora soli TaxID=2926618 RepID=UPI001F5A6F51|nr:serine/threonine-protein kinase [Saccharopolyspora soli]MCI2420907.1 serine/threonine protein kinase [Saccharopolyspora soli]
MEDETEDETPVRPDRPDITRLLPRYRLREQLSQTLMSEVFHAEDTECGRDVALKVIRPALLRQTGFAVRFKRESDIARTLSHPNIVETYAAGQVGAGDEALGYLAMRFVLGANLGKVIAVRGRLGLAETVAVARQVASALDSAHAQGLIHRDVKPANILVENGTNQVYLCDFGIAKNIAQSSITVTDAALGTALYLSPEQQANGRDVDHRADVYSLGCVLYDCLAGRTLTTRERRVHPIPLLGSPVDRVLRKAMSDDPARRHATCGELAEELAAAAERTPRLRHLSAFLAITALCLVLALIAALLVAVVDPAPDRAALARAPAALRDDCRVVDATMAGASSALSCQDGAGRVAVTELFANGAVASGAYARVISESGVAEGQGDCATATGAEHRYPATGPARGRVLCYLHDDRAVVVWTDTEAGTVSRAEAPTTDDAALRRSWSEWVGADDAFPSADERALLDVAAGVGCARVPVGDLDAFPGAVAGVTCVPRGSGARAVSYYRFASLPDLRASFTGRVSSTRAPSGVSCATAPGFLGTQRHDWLGVDLGQVLCQPGPDGTLAMDWSMEPLLLAGRVVGNEPTALTGWWSQWHLAPLGRIISAVNAQSAPPFPTEPERALLDHIPPVSRVNCVRPSPEQVWRDVGAASAVGVACGRTSGAALVVYYQFPDVAAMRSAFNDTGDSGEDCITLPPDFNGDRGYSRGGSTGRLRCGFDESTGERTLAWTDDRLAIAVHAHQGTEPFAMIDWWTHDAGPV